MSAQGYYNGGSGQNDQRHGYQGYQDPNSSQQHQYGSVSGSQPVNPSNPYGYPESNAPQPYHGQDNYQQQGYGQQGYSHQQYGQEYGQQQSYQSYNQSSQGYNSQSYQGQQSQYPPSYGESNQYPPTSNLNQPTSAVPPNHYGYTNDEPRQQPYGQQAPQTDPAWGYGGAAPQTLQPQQQPPYDPNNPEADRGFLGAVAGGAAGVYGGHKMGHGFLGGIGGAIAGSKLQDYAKDKRKEKKDAEEEEKRRKQHAAMGMGMAGGAGVAAAAAYSHSHHNQQQQQPLRGNFSTSSQNITLDKSYDLIASVSDRHGHQKLASINLNEHLSNEWGHFKWVPSGGNFGGSARNVRLHDGGRVLEAELGDGQGGWKTDRIVLDERIGNEDGDLVFIG